MLLAYISSIYRRINVFRGYSNIGRSEVMKALIGGNPIDAEEFYVVLAKSLPQAELEELLGSITKGFEGMLAGEITQHLNQIENVRTQQSPGAVPEHVLADLSVTYCMRPAILKTITQRDLNEADKCVLMLDILIIR